MEDNTVIIIPTYGNGRKDWPEAFQEMAKNGDDELVIPDVFEDEDFQDWTCE